MTVVPDLRFTGPGRPPQGDHVEPNGHIPELSPLDEPQGRVRQPPLLLVVHRPGQFVERLRLARPDLDDDNGLAVQGEGVERIFPLLSPRIARIEVKKTGHVRRAKLYYLRNRVGKATRLKERKKGEATTATKAQKAERAAAR